MTTTIPFANLSTDAQAREVDDMARRLVSQDVRYCVSALVSSLLAMTYQDDSLISDDDASTLSTRAPDADDYRDMVGDLEGGALVVIQEDGQWRAKWVPNEAEDEGDPDLIEYADSDDDTELGAWRAGYELANGDTPNGGEIYEHWLVTEFLAGFLETHGESVADDVAGLTIWGRATTGQAIYMDAVIQRIARAILEA